MNLPASFANLRLLRDEPLAKYTAARLGGPADWLFIARGSLAELAAVMTTAWREGLPVRVIGGGANVLVSDAGVRGLVVVNHVHDIAFEPQGIVTASSGTGLTTLARKCASRGLGGFEWAVSVPGTVGGAVVNNAGAHGRDMAASLQRMTLVTADEPEPQVWPLERLEYSYRTSSLKRRTDRRFLVLSAQFAFTSADPADITARMEAFIVHRKQTQPPGASLGSIFKNPPGDYAGRLIEACGLKGYSIGGAQVSPVHANFFINAGRATATDYYSLIRHVQSVVATQTGVHLELEVELLGEGFAAHVGNP